MVPVKTEPQTTASAPNDGGENESGVYPASSMLRKIKSEFAPSPPKKPVHAFIVYSEKNMPKVQERYRMVREQVQVVSKHACVFN